MDTTTTTDTTKLMPLNWADRNLIVSGLGLLLLEITKNPKDAPFLADEAEVRALRDRIRGRA